MGTNCKIVIGYVDYHDDWIVEEEYYSHYDGYPEAIVPIIKKCGMNTEGYFKHDFEKIIEQSSLDPDYIYLIDMGNPRQIKVSVLGFDWNFYRKYCVTNYKIECEFVFDGGIV